MDRFNLILEIFNRRAQTREAKLQVELASLKHKKTTIVHLFDADYAQQRGSTGAVSGAGETALEVSFQHVTTLHLGPTTSDCCSSKEDRERTGWHDTTSRTSSFWSNKGPDHRTSWLHQFRKIGIGQPTYRIRSSLWESCLYFLGFSHARVHANHRSTHSTSRLDLPSGRRAVVLDTVGFISDLPQLLQTAFRSTLEEVELASVILHVRDIVHVTSTSHLSHMFSLNQSIRKRMSLTSWSD